jgi:hypothetical protein
MEFGAIECIFCHRILPITDDYPWVGAVLQCSKCRGYMIVQGHYLNNDGSITFAVSNLPQKYLRKLNEILKANR